MLRISIAIVLFTASVLIMSFWDPTHLDTQSGLQPDNNQAQAQLALPVE